MEGKKSYQLSIKKANKEGMYDVYLGDLKLDFQVGRRPNLADDASKDVALEDGALDIAARFIVKLARSFARSQERARTQSEKTEVKHG